MLREAKWMSDLSLTKAEHVQYEQGVNASNLGVANVYAEIQGKYGDLMGQVLQEDEKNWKQFLQNSTSSKLQASGATGKSIDRIAALDLAEYFTNSSRRGRELTNAGIELQEQGYKAAGQAKQQQEAMFAKNAFVKMPDFEPPKPVMQNVGAAAFMDALKIGSSVIGMGSGLGQIKESNIIPGWG